MIMNWTEPKGEILIIQKPLNNLDIEIITTQSVYSPGNKVSYQINVRDHATKQLVKSKNVFVSVTVTDDSVFG